MSAAARVQDGEPIISVSHVHHRYRGGDRAALRDVTLSIRQGACFGLLGPNGAGKSTLIGLMTGALRLRQGDIVVDGHDVRTDIKPVRTATALAPQDLAFYPALTGRENLSFFAGVQGLSGEGARARIAKASATCQLDEVLDRRAETYSGGLKRRLNLAIALVAAPRLLYLDEPTVGIDARSRQLIVEAIDALRRSGVTIVYTSHYMEEVETLCDAVAVIDGGEIVALEEMDALLREGAGRRLLITLEAPLADPARASLGAGAWIDATRVDLALDSESALEGVIARVHAAGGTIARLDYGASRLETIYLGLLDRGGPA